MVRLLWKLNSVSWFSYDVRESGRDGLQLLCRLACGAATNASWTAVSCIDPSALGDRWAGMGLQDCLCLCLRPEKLISLIPVQNIQRIVSAHNDMETTGTWYQSSSNS